MESPSNKSQLDISHQQVPGMGYIAGQSGTMETPNNPGIAKAIGCFLQTVRSQNT